MKSSVVGSQNTPLSAFCNPPHTDFRYSLPHSLTCDPPRTQKTLFLCHSPHACVAHGTDTRHSKIALNQISEQLQHGLKGDNSQTLENSTYLFAVIYLGKG